ncbi:putative ribosome quality control (RQC) complex YloA/Tae2 family protein [Ruminiclostridium sufflavum DSM 19573]|uniref:Rqc2 homolog RqcH n=1 Tax=Ruminiclostridium sufflavum DSM 19573 TaxID=1121337 RepID=A0A318XLM5_9FIRM|nr:NFACT RNA binding domain-containing protein [Ruminiclostridium sufflavum]PYG87407.1 putative ribosome quality control (RQC) complex YloA/Tae2 family protein [Ruminiclostridium sufflavum DSM 19573]
MPFDGIVTKCIVNELNRLLSGGRVDKVFQPESDEIVLLVRSNGQNYRLVASANASYPRLHVTSAQKENPQTPPVFCMLMRKHISGGKLLNISFHDYERVISINVESVNELGDLSVKRLVVEIMGKYSNIILLNSEDKIIDAVKHIDSDISSVREIMPARQYFLPPPQDKQLPESISPAALLDSDVTSAKNIENLLLSSIKGFSPYTCRDICAYAGVSPKTPLADLLNTDKVNIISALSNYIDKIRNNSYKPCIIYEDKNFLHPADFYCFTPSLSDFVQQFDTLSSALDEFYAQRDTTERLGQKKGDVAKVVKNGIERLEKKLSIFDDKLREVAGRDKLKLYGELITANIYCIPQGAETARVLNYYSENEEYLDIPLDENRSAQDNAQRYFKQYSKAKSTHLNVTRQLQDTLSELQYFESVKAMLDNCGTKQEIDEIRQELTDQGYMRLSSRNLKKKQDKPSSPLEFTSADGFRILVGKNNKQNDLLTLKTASSYDLWLHTKNIPGSHVIVRTERQEIPASTLLEAATLAAYFSSARMSCNVPVDYTQVKNVKKPSGAKPGMVIYESFKTINVSPDEAKVNYCRVNRR